MNRRNLRKLANYLLNLSNDYDHFGMATYNNDGRPRQAMATAQCHTVACALGHGPYAGILPLTAEGSRDWSDYQAEVFGLDCFEWAWCFEAGWYRVDNTPKGAALRIFYLLDEGVPQRYFSPSRHYKKLYTNAYDIVAA